MSESVEAGISRLLPGCLELSALIIHGQRLAPALVCLAESANRRVSFCCVGLFSWLVCVLAKPRSRRFHLSTWWISPPHLSAVPARSETALVEFWRLVAYQNRPLQATEECVRREGAR